MTHEVVQTAWTRVHATAQLELDLMADRQAMQLVYIELEIQASSGIPDALQWCDRRL